MTRAVHSIEQGRALSRALVDWYRRTHRDLPWRRTRDPYAVWVSEIMLQQTRVDVVVPYYERFLARWPDPGSLAAANVDDVLHAWSGLGYYRRARQLVSAAQAVVREHGGAVPRDETSLLGLPGIGRYTAGAIRSIAFGEPAPIVDGNVARVLSRAFALRGGPGNAAWERRLWTLAAALVPEDAASEFNQGLMELGATVCTPRAPRCAACPWSRHCRAHAMGREEAYPPPKERSPSVRVDVSALVLVRAGDGALALRKREAGERNAGFWEVPLEEGDSPRWTGWPRPMSAPVAIGSYRHQILSRTHVVRVLWAESSSLSHRAWIDPARMNGLPLTTMTKKALALAERARTGGIALTLPGIEATK